MRSIEKWRKKGFSKSRTFAAEFECGSASFGSNDREFLGDLDEGRTFAALIDQASRQNEIVGVLSQLA